VTVRAWGPDVYVVDEAPWNCGTPTRCWHINWNARLCSPACKRAVDERCGAESAQTPCRHLSPLMLPCDLPAGHEGRHHGVGLRWGTGEQPTTGDIHW